MPLLDLRGDSSACAASGLTKRWKANQGGQEELHSRRQPGAALPCRSPEAHGTVVVSLRGWLMHPLFRDWLRGARMERVIGATVETIGVKRSRADLSS